MANGIAGARKFDPGAQFAIFVLGAHRLAEDVAMKTGCDVETALCEVLLDVAILESLNRFSEEVKVAMRNRAYCASWADMRSPIQFPDHSIKAGSIWTMENGSHYAAVEDRYYTLDGDTNQVLSDEDGNPIFQGLAPEDGEDEA